MAFTVGGLDKEKTMETKTDKVVSSPVLESGEKLFRAGPSV